MGEARPSSSGGVEEAGESASRVAQALTHLAHAAPAVFERDEHGRFGWEHHAEAAHAHLRAAEAWRAIRLAAGRDLAFRAARALQNEERHSEQAREHLALVPVSAGGSLSSKEANELELGWHVEQSAYPSLSSREAERIALQNLRSSAAYYSMLYSAFDEAGGENPWRTARAGQLSSMAVRELEAALRAEPPNSLDAATIRRFFQRFGRRIEAELSAAALRSVAPTPPSTSDRETWPDGRWKAREGDTVYQVVRGFGGSAASLRGVVRKTKSGMRVSELTANSFFPSSVGAKSQTYDASWTVAADPLPRTCEAKRRIAARQKEEERTLEEAESVAAGRRKAAQAVASGESFLTLKSPVQHAVTDHLAERAGKLIENDPDGFTQVRWEDGSISTVSVPSDTITVGNEELSPQWEVLLRATTEDPDPAKFYLGDWTPVDGLADARAKVLAFISENRVPMDRWHGGVVVRDGITFAEVTYYGTIQKDGHEIDSEGKRVFRPIPIPTGRRR